MKTKPDLHGRIAIQFTIGVNGKVIAAKVALSTLANPDVEKQIVATIMRWEFPRPTGGEVVITYPFSLRATGDEMKSSGH